MRVAVLGTVAPHKGQRVLEEAAAQVLERRLPLEFVVIGQLASPSAAPPNLQETGRYEASELASLIAAEDPHVLLFAARCPETYSYTLTVGLASGRPIVASDLGAFSERLTSCSISSLVLGRPGYRRDFDPSNLCAMSLRYHPRTVSGLAALATSSSAFRPSR